MTIRIPEDALIEEIGALFDKIRFAEFPRLEVEEVTDDGETFVALRCPRCGNLATEEDLYAVDFAERWNSAWDFDFDHRRIQFDGDESGEFDSTVWYQHDDHAVQLPDGFREMWA